MATIAVFSPKGGVGKTMLAVNLATASALRSRRRTLLWDLDAQAAASFVLGRSASGIEAREVIEGRIAPSRAIVPSVVEGLDLLPADATLRGLDALFDRIDRAKRLRRLLRGFDHDRIVIDCPPGLGAGADQVLRAADLVVLPAPPELSARRAADALADHIVRRHRGRVATMPVLTMVDRRRARHREAAAGAAAIVPLSALVEAMAERRAPLAHYAPRSPAALAVDALWVAIERRLCGG